MAFFSFSYIAFWGFAFLAPFPFSSGHKKMLRIHSLCSWSGIPEKEKS
jgi:hypothetical protein